MTTKTEQRILLIIPLALLFLGIILTNLSGPYYLSLNFDPDYAYLFNSLNILTLHAPTHTDHPGTTVQEIGAVVVLVRWLGSGLTGDWRPLQATVLSHPEEFLHSINLVLNILIAAAIYCAAWQLYRCSKSLLAALILQIGFCFYLETFVSQTRVSPEPLLVATGFALMVPLVPVVLGSQDGDAGAHRAITAGALFGFGMVTKLTFLPWIAVVVLFRSTAHKLVFLGVAAASFMVFTLPIATELPRVVGFLTAVIFHTDRYGTGRLGILRTGALHANALAEYHQEPILFVLLFGYAALLLAQRLSRGRWPALPGLTRLLVVGCMALGMQVIATAKSPAPQYNLPALVLTAFINALAVAILLRYSRSALLRSLMLAGLFSALTLGLSYSLRRLGTWTDMLNSYREDVNVLATTVGGQPGCQLIGMYRSSVPTYALAFGNDYSGGRQASVLEGLYPDVVSYNIFVGQFLSFKHESEAQSIRRLVSSGHCVIMQGAPLERPGTGSLRGLRLQQIALGVTEGAYKIVEDPTGAQPLEAAPVLPPGSIIVEAERFASGNVVVDTTYYGLGIGVITSPTYPAFAEYAIPVPSAGRYDVLIRYASGESRPVRLLLNGNAVTADACSDETGGFDPLHQLWQKAGSFEFRAGANLLRFETSGAFPHIDKFALTAVP